MNIGIFCDTYTPQVNGVVTVVRALKQGLESCGHRAYVFTVKHPKAVEEEGVYRLLSLQFLNEPQHRIGMFINKQLFDIVRPLNLDLIHTHSEFSLYLAARMVSKKFKIPSVHTLHTHYLDYFSYIPPVLRQITEREYPKIFRHILRSQRCVIVPSRKNAEFLSTIKHIPPVRVIPNGLDLSPFLDRSPELKEAAAGMRARFSVAEGEDMIVFIGRLGTEKNVAALLENFREIRRYRKAKLVLVGDGPNRHALETHCHEQGLSDSVIFSGYMRWPDEIREVYAAADLFMSASHSEVHPISFIEALASGLPIVAAADSSIEDMVINGENGWTVENDTLLWEKAVAILENREERLRMSKRSEEISRLFSIDHFVNSMLACYEEFRNK